MLPNIEKSSLVQIVKPLTIKFVVLFKVIESTPFRKITFVVNHLLFEMIYHFWNNHLYNVCLPACDCDPRGITKQQCNKATGHCVCVEGVSGHRCDVCARGYSGEFPSCERCHQCFADWDAIVGQLTNQTHRLVNKVNTIKASGMTGPYKKTIDNVEQSAGAIRAILAQNPATQPLSEIQQLLEQAKWVDSWGSYSVWT